MKTVANTALALLLALGLLAPLQARSQDSPGRTDAKADADAIAIQRAALDYIDGWYTGDAVRMERALHPRLAKRVVGTNPRSGRSVLHEGSALELVQETRTGEGRQTPVATRREDVRILDRFADMATVRVDATDWVDYLQMARFDGRWVIINVLWAPRPKT